MYIMLGMNEDACSEGTDEYQLGDLNPSTKRLIIGDIMEENKKIDGKLTFESLTCPLCKHVNKFGDEIEHTVIADKVGTSFVCEKCNVLVSIINVSIKVSILGYKCTKCDKVVKDKGFLSEDGLCPKCAGLY